MIIDDNSKQRKIIHIDMDAFFASIEQRDNPALRGKPVIVGGKPESRGVVAAASYEARKFGIHSAMPSHQAYKLCPSAFFVKPRFEAYKQASLHIRDIFQRYTDIIEPLSLDEAYLDVTLNHLNEISATRLAKTIRQDILQEMHLTSSAGVSFNKFLAKIASDVNKPNGMKVITPEQAEAFVAALPIGRFYGVGKRTEEKMKHLGILTGADLRECTLEFLLNHFGSLGNYLYNASRAEDDRPVVTHRERKSLGNETTFAEDITDLEVLLDFLDSLADEVSASLKKRNLKGKTVTLKVKYSNFVQITRSKTLPRKINDKPGIFSQVKELLANTQAGERPVRLLGIALSGFNEESLSASQQLELDLRHS